MSVNLERLRELVVGTSLSLIHFIYQNAVMLIGVNIASLTTHNGANDALVRLIF
jgi:hypothetical protein